MSSGRLRFASGLTVNCSYEFTSSHVGDVEVMQILDALSPGDSATLLLANEGEFAIEIMARTSPGAFGFRVVR
jgi:hypothetical protein